MVASWFLWWHKLPRGDLIGRFQIRPRQRRFFKLTKVQPHNDTELSHWCLNLMYLTVVLIYLPLNESWSVQDVTVLMPVFLASTSDQNLKIVWSLDGPRSLAIIWFLSARLSGQFCSPFEIWNQGARPKPRHRPSTDREFVPMSMAPAREPRTGSQLKYLIQTQAAKKKLSQNLSLGMWYKHWKMY